MYQQIENAGFTCSFDVFRNGEDILYALSEWTAEGRIGADTAAHMKLSDIFDEYSRMAYSSMSGAVVKLPNPERHMETIKAAKGSGEQL